MPTVRKLNQHSSIPSSATTLGRATCRWRTLALFCWLCSLLLLSLGVPTLASSPPAVFEDIAGEPDRGLTYARTPSATNATFERIKRQPLYTMPSIVASPEKPRGAPGVAILDFDGDLDLDLYVTNGPGTDNSLFSNLLTETGRLTFEDVGAAAGVGARDQDSTGVCFGDLDNDGDPDLLVLGRSEPNRLFENRGDGSFADVTAESGLGDSRLGHTSCALGDVDGDGLLDVAIANTYDWTQRTAIIAEPWALNHPNLLLANRGNLRFEDISEASGIRRLRGHRPAPPEGSATITWALALVDLDGDGDLDLVQADDQGALHPSQVNRGYLQVLLNDGSGRFEDRTPEAGTAHVGAGWMGLAFGDFNCDGQVDVFGTNMGDYAYSAIGIPMEPGEMTSRWFLGRGDGSFLDPGVGPDLKVGAFGWSVMTPDVDNDGDPDLVYYGSLDVTIHTITADNPGVLLENVDCLARFRWASEGLPMDHGRRNVQGAAMGDLDRDGFVDLVSVSAFDIPESVPLKAYPASYGSPHDAQARYVEAFAPAGSGAFLWNGYQFPDGSLAVEMNDGRSGHPSVAVRLLGTAGLLPEGAVNRDGVGALVRFTPEGGLTALRPLVAGSSYASQNALEMVFGLGRADRGRLEVRWPSGVRTRLDDVLAGERLVVPEIPCSADALPEAPAGSREDLESCYRTALEALAQEGRIADSLAERLLAGALALHDEALGDGSGAGPGDGPGAGPGDGSGPGVSRPDRRGPPNRFGRGGVPPGP